MRKIALFVLAISLAGCKGKAPVPAAPDQVKERCDQIEVRIQKVQNVQANDQRMIVALKKQLKAAESQNNLLESSVELLAARILELENMDRIPTIWTVPAEPLNTDVAAPEPEKGKPCLSLPWRKK